MKNNPNKKKFSFFKAGFMTTLLALTVSGVFATTPVTINFLHYDGTAFSIPETVSYTSNGGASWTNLTFTGSDIVSLPAGSYTFKTTYNYYTQSQAKTITATAISVTFQTVQVTVNLNDGSPGTLLTTLPAGVAAGVVQYYGDAPGGWYSFGSATGGTCTHELLPGSYSFNMTYHGEVDVLQPTGTASTPASIGNVSPISSTNNVINFNTTKLTMNDPSGGAITYSPSSIWYTYTGAVNLLPGTYYFRVNGGAEAGKAVSGPTQTLMVAPCTLPSIGVANNGSGCGGSYTLTAPAGNSYLWSPGGATTGSIVVNSNNTYHVTVGYDFNCNGSTPGSVVYSTPITVTPNTATVRLIDHNGNGLSGATVYYSNGGGWVNFTNTTDGSGYTCATLAPGNYTFLVQYNGGTEQIAGTYAASSNPVVSAQTEDVTFNLYNHIGIANANLLSGGAANMPYLSASNFIGGNATTTGSCSTNPQIELLPGSYTCYMGYNSLYQGQTVTVSSVGGIQNANFQTSLVTFNLYNHNGIADANLLGGGAANMPYLSASNFVGGNAITSTSTSADPQIELLPGSYTCYMGYNSLYQSQTLTVISAGTTQAANFQTSLVTFNLYNHSGLTGANLLSGGTASMPYLSASNFVGSNATTTSSCSTNPQIELLPGSYTCYMGYNSLYESQTVTVASGGTTQPANFQTSLVTFNLYDHNGTTGADLLSGGAASMPYLTASNFVGSNATTTTSCSTNPQIELLPGSYTCYMGYNSLYESQTVTVASSGTTQPANFQTSLVTFNLYNHNNTTDDANLLSGGTASMPYLTPSNFVGGNATTSNSTATDPGIELLPGTYTCYMGYNSLYESQILTVSSAGTTQPENFQTSLVTFNLYDHNNNLLSGGAASMPYMTASNFVGSNATTTTSCCTNPQIELLPGSYTCYMGYNSLYQSQSLTVASAGTTQPENFRTILATINLYGSSDDLLTGGTASMPYLTADNFINANATTTTSISTNPEIELLAGWYTFYMSNSDGTQSQNVDISDPSWAQTVNFTDGAAARHVAPGAGASVAAATEFSVYPNPATDRITINFSSTTGGQASIRVADISGKVIISETIESVKGSNTHDVNLGNLPSGIYLIMFNNDDNNEVTKINVVH